VLAFKAVMVEATAPFDSLISSLVYLAIPRAAAASVFFLRTSSSGIFNTFKSSDFCIDKTKFSGKDFFLLNESDHFSVELGGSQFGISDLEVVLSKLPLIFVLVDSGFSFIKNSVSVFNSCISLFSLLVESLSGKIVLFFGEVWRFFH
jgi:hypothetical protein